MQYILHITKDCNFDCGYCYQEKTNDFMDEAIAIKLVDFAYHDAISNNKKNATISFYGGEPLLCKELIYKVVKCCNEKIGVTFDFKMTTNGWYLDQDFINFAQENRFDIALSIDGVKAAHDRYRVTKNKEKTFDKIVEIAKNLLEKLPDSAAMMTVDPDTANYLSESVEYLYNLGFRTIVTTPNFQGRWENFDVLKQEYEKTAEWYGEKLLAECNVKLPLFDNKLINNVTGMIQENKCIPMKYRMSIDTDGGIYPCIQYVHFNRYRFGMVKDEVMFDGKKMDEIAREYSIENCEGCALRDRCDNNCGCKNLLLGNDAKVVDPIVCEHERMLIPIVDRLGERIFLPGAFL